MSHAESLGVDFLLEKQRNRHPLLFLDRVDRVVPGSTVEATKAFSYNEWFFPAHFEDEPLVPGFVLLEAMAQTFILTFLSQEEHSGGKTSLTEVSNAKFKRKVVPGDVLSLKANLDTFRFGLAIGTVEARVSEEFACSAAFKVILPTATPPER